MKNFSLTFLIIIAIGSVLNQQPPAIPSHIDEQRQEMQSKIKNLSEEVAFLEVKKENLEIALSTQKVNKNTQKQQEELNRINQINEQKIQKIRDLTNQYNQQMKEFNNKISQSAQQQNQRNQQLQKQMLANKERVHEKYLKDIERIKVLRTNKQANFQKKIAQIRQNMQKAVQNLKNKINNQNKQTAQQMRIQNKIRNELRRRKQQLEARVKQIGNQIGDVSTNQQQLIKCINSFKLKIQGATIQIFKDVNVHDYMRYPVECKDLNPDFGFQRGGCFDSLVKDYFSLSKSIKRYLSPEVLTSFGDIYSETNQNIENIDKQTRTCLDNPSLKQRKPECYSILSKLLGAKKIDSPVQDASFYEKYLVLTSQFKHFFNEKFWWKVSKNCE